MSHPLTDAFGEWVFECRSESDSDVLADRDFASARDRLHKNGWKIISEERHVCMDPTVKSKRVLKTMFTCSKPEPVKTPPAAEKDVKRVSANDWDPYEE